MDLEYHTEQMGHLLVTLHSLELILRICLEKSDDIALDWSALKKDDDVPATVLTQQRRFECLLGEFNKLAEAKNSPALDVKLALLRNAIVHGRVILEKKWLPARLVQFRDEKGGKTKIELNEQLTFDWYHTALRRFGHAYDTALLMAISMNRATVNPDYEASLRAGAKARTDAQPDRKP